MEPLGHPHRNPSTAKGALDGAHEITVADVPQIILLRKANAYLPPNHGGFASCAALP
jgi:hypothetical protein